MKCGKPLENAQDEYCPDCRKRQHAFDGGRALLSYEGAIRPSIYRLKYEGKQEYGRVFGEEMARYLGPWISRMRITRIVPIPLHPSRLAQRGYNQAALPARELGRKLHIPVDEKLLCRTRRTEALKALSGSERRASLAGAFETRGKILPGERILLVDDIYTTGSTADAAASCLKQSEKCLVYVVVVAIGG